MNKRSFFIIMLLIFTVGILTFQISFDRTFSDAKVYQFEIKKLKEENLRTQLRMALKDYQIMELSGQDSERLPASTGVLNEELTPKLWFSEIKKMHKGQDCQGLVRKAREFKQNYSFSPNLPEVVLLSGDCFVQLQEYDSAVEEFSLLIDHYPSHIATAHGLLKLAQVFTLMGKLDESREVLKVVERHFSHEKNIVSEAQSLLSGERSGL